MDGLIVWIAGTGGPLLAGVILYYVKRIDTKLDDVNAQLVTLRTFMDKELRLMDVRLTRIETHLGFKQ